MKDHKQRMKMQLGMLRDMGHELDGGSIIMDLGCGAGNLVNEYRKNGYQAFGCDFEFKDGPYVAELEQQRIIRKIDPVDYRLPFDDNSIDFVITDQVFEHVQDYPAVLAEVNRVLKIGGVSLNFFPSRYRPIEPHVFVPLASMIQKYSWLKFWSSVGVRTKEQRGLSVDKIAHDNYNYLTTKTKYLSKSQIRKYCSESFTTVRFSEDVFFKYFKKGAFLYPVSKVFVFLPKVYSTLRTRVLYVKK